MIIMPEDKAIVSLLSPEDSKALLMALFSEPEDMPQLSDVANVVYVAIASKNARISAAKSNAGKKGATTRWQNDDSTVWQDIAEHGTDGTDSTAWQGMATVSDTVTVSESVSDNSSCPQSSISDAEGKQKKVLAHDAEAYKAARYLDKRICENVPSKQPADEKTLQRWAGDIDKINRIDGQSWDDISDVLEFCQNDFFWRTNILSGKKLREKFIQLLAKAGNTS